MNLQDRYLTIKKNGFIIYSDHFVHNATIAYHEAITFHTIDTIHNDLVDLYKILCTNHEYIVDLSNNPGITGDQAIIIGELLGQSNVIIDQIYTITTEIVNRTS